MSNVEKIGRLTDAHHLVGCAEVGGHTALRILCKYGENQQYARDYDKYD